MTAPLQDSEATAVRHRLLRVRLSEPRWWRRDQGPLLLRTTPGGECLRLLSRPFGGLRLLRPGGARERLKARDAARLDGEFFLAYPRWRGGAATARQWLALSRACGGRSTAEELMAVAAALVPVVPALAVLLLASLRNRSWPIFLAFLGSFSLGAILAGWATSSARLRRGRDVNLRLHGLLWDRLLASWPTAFDRLPPAVLATRLREALSAAQREAEAPDQLRAAAVTTAAAMAIAAIATPTLVVAAGIELFAGFAALHLLWRRVGRAMLAAGEWSPAYERAITDLSNMMPTFRGLGAQDFLLRRMRRALDDLMAAGDATERAVIAARTGARLLLLLLPSTIGTAAALGLAPASSPLRLAAAMLATCAAADGVRRIGVISGTRQARRQRMAGAMRPLAGAAEDPGDTTARQGTAGRFEVLSVENLGFAYGTAPPILSRLDLRLKRGEVVAITGPSGCGKTTLLHLIFGLLEPTSGSVRVNRTASCSGVSPAAFERIGIVFQDQELPPLTIRGFVAGANRLPAAAIDDAIKLVGLEAAIAQLPMGMQTLIVPNAFASGLLQRLVLARALAQRPQLLLLDDASSALGSCRGKALFEELRRRGMTVLLTAQDAAPLGGADRMLRLEAGRLTSQPARDTTEAAPPPPAAPVRRA